MNCHANKSNKSDKWVGRVTPSAPLLHSADSGAQVTRPALQFIAWLCGWVMFTAGGLLCAAGAVDVSQLPPPATVTIDFARDIRPILENSCLNCHGPEKPKGKFRLDNYEAAMKGGVNGVDIIPGESAKSPLILFVAGLVPDQEMPPVGKGDPLTDEQIGLLRAWIDQGVDWDVAMLTNELSFSITPVVGLISVSGDEHKFREHHGQKEGLAVGLKEFESFEQTATGSKILLAGHVLQNDYRTVLSVEKNELGFIRTGWEQYRKYYDDSGGYFPFPANNQPIRSLDRDLHLDIGRAWIDFGLTLPDWPRMVLGYEYIYKRGDESLTGWGGVGTGLNARNVAPVRKAVDEAVHVIKFDLDAELRGVTIEERFRGEFYQLNTHYTNSAARGPVSQNVRERNSYFQGANTIRLEKPIKEWWLGSAGYLYSKLNADATFKDTARYANLPTLYIATVPEITLDRESHVFNVNSLLGPFAGLTFTAGVQSEWTREHGVGGGVLHRIPFTFQAPVSLNTNAASLFADRDANTVSESLALRYTKIPYTTVFAEARLQQQSIGRTDSDIQPGSPSGSYLRNIDYTRQLSDLRLGFNTSPWRGVSFSTHYRRYDDDSEFRNNNAPQPVGSYPGFIRARDLLTDEIEAKLTLRPARWLKTTLSYQYLVTDSWTDTRAAFNPTTSVTNSPGGKILAGEYDSQIYSVGLTVTPWRRLYFDTTFSYQTSTTRTADNDVPSVEPYRGDVYSVFANGTFILSTTMDLLLGYSFATADFSQDNFAGGLPVGIMYRQHGTQVGLLHRISKNVTAQLQCGYYHYDEPSSGGANDYVASSVFGAITFRLP